MSLKGRLKMLWNTKRVFWNTYGTHTEHVAKPKYRSWNTRTHKNPMRFLKTFLLLIYFFQLSHRENKCSSVPFPKCRLFYVFRMCSVCVPYLFHVFQNKKSKKENKKMKKEVKINSLWVNRQSGEVVKVLDIKAGLVKFRFADLTELTVAQNRFLKVYEELKKK